MSSFDLEVATPEKLVLRRTVTSAQIPAESGYIGVLPGHAPLIGRLGAGELSFESEQGGERLFVGGGFLQVLPGRAVLLADIAEFPNEINVEQAQRDLDAAQALERSHDPNTDFTAAVRAARFAQARLDVAARK